MSTYMERRASGTVIKCQHTWKEEPSGTVIKCQHICPFKSIFSCVIFSEQSYYCSMLILMMTTAAFFTVYQRHADRLGPNHPSIQ
jgi:hypothetical protein